MPLNEVEAAFYLVGVRTAQAAVLCKRLDFDYEVKARIQTALGRLKTAVNRLQEVEGIDHNTVNACTPCVQGCIDAAAPEALADDVLLDSSRFAIDAHLQEIQRNVEQLARTTDATATRTRDAFDLGVQVGQIEISTGDFPEPVELSGAPKTKNVRKAKRSKPKIHWADDAKASQLLKLLGLGVDDVLPDDAETLAVLRVEVLDDYIGGWSRIEAGLARLVGSASEPEQISSAANAQLPGPANSESGPLEAGAVDLTDVGSVGVSTSVKPRGKVFTYHDRSERRPEEFKYGPLEGSQKQLAEWILSQSPKDPRKLRQRADRTIWFTRIQSRLYEAWFKDQTQFENAKSNAEKK